MSHSLNTSIIDQKYPVRSVHAQQWVNTITSLVFYKFLYFPYFSCTCKLILKPLLGELINILYCTGGVGVGVVVFSISSIPKKACLTFKITFPSGQFWLSVNALKHFELFRRYFLRKRVKKRVFDDGLVARRDVNCKKKRETQVFGGLRMQIYFEFTLPPAKKSNVCVKPPKRFL